MTSYESQFSDKAPLAHPISIYMADGTPLPVHHKGTISSPNLSSSDTFYILKLSLNFLSLGKLCELGIDILLFMVWMCKILGRVKCLGQAIRLDVCLRFTTWRFLHMLFMLLLPLPPSCLIYGMLVLVIHYYLAFNF